MVNEAGDTQENPVTRPTAKAGPSGQPIRWEPVDLAVTQTAQEHGKEQISLADKLPPEYQSELDVLDPSIPQEFQDQARQAAYYFWSLESDKALLDQNGHPLAEKVARLADQLASSGFVQSTYTEALFSAWDRRLGRIPTDPNQALPSWITDRVVKFRRVQPLNKSELGRLAQFYTTYAQTHGVLTPSEDGQEYFVYSDGTPERISSFASTAKFKYYVESDGLRDIDRLEQAFEILRANGVHPHETKLFEDDRLVLYWSAFPAEPLTQQIRQIFTGMGITLRGPAQDSFHIELSKSDQLKIGLRFSNDASLGESGHNRFRWEGKIYEPGAFFRRYLELVFNGAKNPGEPYRISFLPILTGDMPPSPERDALIEDLTRRVRISDKLPVYVSEGFGKISPFA